MSEWLQCSDPRSFPRRGSLVETPEGIQGWVTYHSLDGIGINTEACDESVPPTHMLRDPYRNPTAECIGETYRYVEVAA